MKRPRLYAIMDMQACDVVGSDLDGVSIIPYFLSQQMAARFQAEQLPDSPGEPTPVPIILTVPGATPVLMHHADGRWWGGEIETFTEKTKDAAP